MKNAILLIISLLACLFANVGRKCYTRRNRMGLSGVCIYNSVCFLIAAGVLVGTDGFGSFGLYTLILGLVFGVITALQGITNLLALETGPLSYTTVIVSLSTLISALSGFLFFDETLHPCRILGVVLMIICVLLSAEKKDDEKKANRRWLFFCLITFLATGCIGVLQKVHQSSRYKTELSEFLVVAFVTAAVLCAAVSFVFLKREETQKIFACEKKSVLPLIATAAVGACVAINNKFNLYLSGVMDSAVFFPVTNGGSLVLTTVAALVIFRERLSMKQWIGIGFGIVSVILLCSPFG